jgi:hypothetical protein
MRNRKFSIILAITVSLVLVGSFCFVVSAVPPEGKGKNKVSYEPVKVFDSSATPQYIGILVNTVPQEISTSPQDLLVQPHITVFVTSLGKFLEMYWSGETITYRTQIPFLYFDGPNCTENAYTDRLSQPPPSGTYFVMDNEYYLYGFKDENQIHTFYTMSRYTGEDPPVILSRQERGQPCEDPFTYPSGYSVAFYALTMVDTDFSFPFQQPLTFE